MIRNSVGRTDSEWAATDSSQCVPVMHHAWDKMMHGMDEQGRRRDDRPRRPSENWEQDARAAIYRARIVSLERSNRELVRKVEKLSDQVDKLAECVKDYQSRPAVVPISTFAPEPYEMLGSINIVLRHGHEGFVASFVEANINASGDTQAEALEMVKDMILGTFDRLASKNDNELGPGPLRQKQVLSAIIRMID